MSKEAMTLALRALRFANDDGYKNEISQAAITALKEALAKQEKGEPYGYVRADGGGLFIYGEHQFQNTTEVELVPVYLHPKQEQGGPVAEVKRNSSGQIYIEWRDGESAIANLIDAKLYTTPQLAQKPLTDEQIEEIARITCIGISPHEDTLSFARVIEAAHGIKEKNSA